MARVTLAMNTAPLMAAAGDLAVAAELPDGVRQRLVDLIEVGHGLVRFQVDGHAAGTCDIAIVAYPSKRLEMLLAALRTGNCDLAAIERAFGHGNSPSLGSLQDTAEAESGAGGKPASDLRKSGAS